MAKLTMRFSARLTRQIIASLLVFSITPAAYSAQMVLLDQFQICCSNVGISYSGQTVVAVTSGGTPTYWTTTLGFIQASGRNGNFIGISGDGTTMVGGAVSASYRYSIPGGFQDLPNTAGQTTAPATGPTALSDNGSIAVGKEYAGGTSYAVVWDSNGDPARLSTGQALDVSGDGSVIVGTSRVSSRDQAVRWDWNGLTQSWERAALTAGTTNTGAAFAVSRNGDTVFGQVDNSAFRWTSGTGTVDIGTGFQSSAIYATTTDGIFGGGFISVLNAPARTAAIWDETSGWRTLASLLMAAGIDENDIPDFRDVAAMSSDGRYIVASYYTGSSSPVGEYWIDLGAPLAVVPLPAAAWLYLSGLLGLTALTRRNGSRIVN